MIKIKRKLLITLSLILILSLAILGFSFLNMDLTANAATYSQTISDNGVYHLYNDGSNGVDTKALWTLTGKNLGTHNTTSTSDTLNYYREGGVLNDPDGIFTANVKFSNDLVNAVNSGKAKIQVRAYMWNESKNFGFTDGTGSMRIKSEGTEIASVGNFTFSRNKNDLKSCNITKLNGIDLSIAFWGIANGVPGVGILPGSYCTTNYFVGQPTIEVFWDKEAPTVSTSTLSNEWTNQDRILTIATSDDASGIKSVTINGTEITGSIDENPTTPFVCDGGYLKRTYEYPVSKNGTYNIVVKDNEGKTVTTTYEETKIDKDIPLQPVLVAPTDWIHNGYTINASLTNVDESLSPFKYYYTIDGSIPDNTSNEFVKEGMNIDFKQNGKYLLQVVAIDEAGNISTVTKQDIKIDDTRYSVSVLESLGLQADVQNLTRTNEFLRGDNIKVTLDIDPSYKLFGFKINDTLMNKEDLLDLGNNKYSYTFSIDDINPYFNTNFEFDIDVKENLLVVINKDNYIFNKEGNILDYSLVSEKSSDISIVETSLKIEYFNIERNAVDFFNSGEYIVKFSYQDDNFYLDIEKNVTISKKQIEVTLDTYSVQYTGKEHQINILDIDEKYSSSCDKQILNAGTYDIIINVLNDKGETDTNYISQTIKFTVNKIDLVLELGTKSKQYQDEDKKLTYSIVSGEIIEGDLTDINITRESGENIGTYATKIEYTPNENYNITYSNENFEITKRKVRLVFEGCFLDFSLEYTKDFLLSQLKYTIENLSPAIKEEDVKKVIKLDIKDYDEANPHAGSYKVTNDDFTNPNFEFELVNANVTIAKKIVYIIPDLPKTAIYGEKVDINIIAVEGEISKDKIFLKLDGDNNVGIKKVVIDEEKMELVYLQNYELNIFQKTIEILPKDMKVSLIGETSKIYGEKDPEFSLDTTSLDILNKEGLTVEFVRETGENVGLYSISLLNYLNGNYNISLDKEYVFEIKQRELVITPDMMSKTYGDMDQDISYSVTGLQNGDRAIDVLEGELSRIEGENVNSYEITLGSLSSITNNYIVKLSETKSYYTIEKADFSLELDNFESIYNGKVVELKVPCNLPLEIKYYKDGKEVQPINAGDYIVKIKTTDTNYMDKEISTKLKIRKANLSLEFPTETYYYTGSKLEYKYNVEGYELEKNYFYSNGSKVENNEVINPDKYIVKLVFKGNENYSSNTYETTLNVIKKSVFINVECDKFIYDGKVKAPIFTTSNSEIESKITYYEVDEEGKEQRVLEPTGSNEKDTTYRYEIVIEDNNYKGVFNGEMVIKKPEVLEQNGLVIEVADKKDLDKEISLEVMKIYTKADGFIETQNMNHKTYEIKDKEIQEIYKVVSLDTSLNNKYIIKIPVAEIAEKDKLSLYVKNGDEFVKMESKIVGADLVIETNNVNTEFMLLLDKEPQSLFGMALRVTAAMVGIGFLSFLTIKIRYKRKPIFHKSKYFKMGNKK